MKKKNSECLVDCQRGIGETLRVKPLTWGHGPNFGSPGIWVVTSFTLSALKFNLKMSSKIKKITTRLQDISAQKDDLYLTENIAGGLTE